MQNGISRAVLASLFTITLQLVSASAHAQANDLIDLGAGTVGHAVNNSGQVALDQGIYNSGTITPLPTVPGGSTPASALAINASGQVAGFAISPVIQGTDPIAYINGSLIDLGSMMLTGTLANGGGGAATGINSSGLVVGWYVSNLIDADTIAFTYSNGTVTDLPTFPCRTFNADCVFPVNGPKAFGINDSEESIGSVAYSLGLSSNNACLFTTDAFSYSNGTWNDFGPGTAYAVNASGQVTGTLTVIKNSTVSDLCDTLGTDAFLNTSGMTTILGTLPGGTNSIGYAINGTGQVVGSSDFTGSSTTHAFFYNGVMTDLNAIISKTDPLRTSVTLTSAVGINDSRLILANGVDSTGLAHAYLLQGPWINVAPATLSFGNEAVGGTSQSQSIVVTNAGSTSMLLGTISASSDFSLQSNSCGPSLAAGAQCTIMAAFAPTVAGALTGNVKVPSSGTNYGVALSGDAPITATLTASKSTASAGTFVTLTWVSAAGSTCTATSGSVASPFNGNIAPSGSMSLTQNIAGTELYEIHCTAPGLPEADSTVMIVWTWPTVTATLSASPSTITAGQSTTLTWTSTNATGCTATGGGSGDNWAGAKATNGSQTITEPFATATASVMLTFGITCSSTGSGLSGQATANVTDNSPPPSKSGGGAIDLVSIFTLLGIFGLGRRAAKRS